MNTETNPKEPSDNILRALKTSNDNLNRRLTRIESRLTQLMMFQGMQTDGRNPIINREAASHV